MNGYKSVHSKSNWFKYSMQMMMMMIITKCFYCLTNVSYCFLTNVNFSLIVHLLHVTFALVKLEVSISEGEYGYREHF